MAESQAVYAKLMKEYLSTLKDGCLALPWAGEEDLRSLEPVLARAFDRAWRVFSDLARSEEAVFVGNLKAALLSADRSQLLGWQLFLLQIQRYRAPSRLLPVLAPFLEFLGSRIPARKSLAPIVTPTARSARPWVRLLVGSDWPSSPSLFLNIQPVNAKSTFKLFQVSLAEGNSTSAKYAQLLFPSLVERVRSHRLPKLSLQDLEQLPEGFQIALCSSSYLADLLVAPLVRQLKRFPLRSVVSQEAQSLLQDFEALPRNPKSNAAKPRNSSAALRVCRTALPERSEFLAELAKRLRQPGWCERFLAPLLSFLPTQDLRILLAPCEDRWLAKKLAVVAAHDLSKALSWLVRTPKLRDRLLRLAPEAVRLEVVTETLADTLDSKKLAELLLASPSQRWIGRLPANVAALVPKTYHPQPVPLDAELLKLLEGTPLDLEDLLPLTPQHLLGLPKAISNWLERHRWTKPIPWPWLFAVRPNYFFTLKPADLKVLFEYCLQSRIAISGDDWLWTALAPECLPATAGFLSLAVWSRKVARLFAGDPVRAQSLLLSHLRRCPEDRGTVLGHLAQLFQTNAWAELDLALFRGLALTKEELATSRVGQRYQLHRMELELARGSSLRSQLPRASSVLRDLLLVSGWAKGAPPVKVTPPQTVAKWLPVVTKLARLSKGRQTCLEVAVHLGTQFLPLLEGFLAKIPEDYPEPGRCFEAEYRAFTIAKKNGKRRVIHEPSQLLKGVQRALLDQGFAQLLPHPCAMGFRPGLSTLDNARPHERKRVVVNVDLEAFFPSTKYPAALKVCSQLWGGVLSPRARHFVAELCTAEGGLPTGAPTSPAIGNLVLLPADSALAKVAARQGVAYTRFADDLSFSSDDDAAVKLLPFVGEVLRTHGYRLAHQKTGIFRKGRRQTVTGLVVNERATLCRKERRLLRAMVDHRVRSLPVTKKGIDVSDAVLRGHLSYLKLTRPSEVQRHLERLEPPKVVPHD